MIRHNYESMRRSSCKHKKVIAKAIESIIGKRRESGSLIEMVSSDCYVTMGCFALNIAPVLYSSTAQRALKNLENPRRSCNYQIE